jgi:beta-ureidopropionase / N-carbamoyl-L-amino-acid hydrolase
MTMGQIGATPKGGCNRQALTRKDGEGRRLFLEWCGAAGFDIRIDTIGNIFARRAGSDPHAPVVLMGSHLDTQPTGGKFDGIFGVLAGLEVIETLNDHQIDTRHPVEVVVWTNEEGCRFDMAMMGSAVWAGSMKLEDAYALADREGRSVRDELRRIGFLGSVPAVATPVKAAFEAHIEQGPVLEAAGVAIGVVTAVQHMSRHRIVIEGVESHAGPTPMSNRKDPMMALADFLPKLYTLADEHAPHGRITFGFMDVRPGSANTVPGRLEMTVDIRHPEQDAYDAMVAGYRAAVSAACNGLGLPCSLSCFWHAPGVVFADSCVQAVRDAVAVAGYAAVDIFSGAGHDACNLSDVVPTGMIFIPCENGISHNEEENVTPEHVTAGANVLLHAVLSQAAG